MKKIFLIKIEAGDNNNKFYNMSEKADYTFEAHWGRVGSNGQKKTFDISLWSTKLKAKLKKGYKDITHLKQATSNVITSSSNSDFNSFFNTFSRYTTNAVNNTYVVDSCTAQQINEAQDIINKLIKVKNTDLFNNHLLTLFEIIPRKMKRVADNLLDDLTHKNKIIQVEQANLDAMDSKNIIVQSDMFSNLNIDFEEIDCPKWLSKKVSDTNSTRKKIHKVYKTSSKNRQVRFDNWLKNQKHNHTEYLFHGTRNANIFSILKTGLVLRPTNAVFSGSVYGEGLYHSAHTTKSMGYTGYDNDSIFLINNVHMGNYYTYDGWYRSGKDISSSQMNYKYLNSKGYDSLYVKPGDGLQNSEYIVYNTEQQVINYIVHFK